MEKKEYVQPCTEILKPISLYLLDGELFINLSNPAGGSETARAGEFEGDDSSWNDSTWDDSTWDNDDSWELSSL